MILAGLGEWYAFSPDELLAMTLSDLSFWHNAAVALQKRRAEQAA